MPIEISYFLDALGAILLCVFLYMVQIFLGLVRLKLAIDRAAANIQSALRERNDDISKLETKFPTFAISQTIDSYMQFEQGAMLKVVKARQHAAAAKSMPELAHAAQTLSALLEQLFTMGERYPSLQSDPGFLELKKHIASQDDRIAREGAHYNALVAKFNLRRERTPYRQAAVKLGYQRRDLFQATEAAQNLDTSRKVSATGKR